MYSLGQTPMVQATVQVATGGGGVGVTAANGARLAWGPGLTQYVQPTGYVPVPYTPSNYAPGYAAYSGMSWWACGMVPGFAGVTMPSTALNYAANWQLQRWLAQLTPRQN